MTHLIEPRHHVSLDDYESIAHLSIAVRELRQEAEGLIPALKGGRVWMVNSTSHGDGVAELLPPLLAVLRKLGIDANWLVMETDDPEFFRLTKRLHNLIHGQGDAKLGAPLAMRRTTFMRECVDGFSECTTLPVSICPLPRSFSRK